MKKALLLFILPVFILSAFVCSHEARAATYEVRVDDYWLKGEGNFQHDLEEAIRKQFPNCRIKPASDVDENKIKDWILTRSDAVDVFVVSSDTGLLKQIIEKGFYSDLNEVKEAKENVQKMDINVQGAVTREGRLAAYPLEMKLGPFFRLNADLAEQNNLLNLSSVSSLQDVYELMKEYVNNEDCLDDRTALMYINEFPLLKVTLDLYDLTLLAEDERLVYDTPEFRDCLAKALEIRDNNWEGGKSKNRILDVTPPLSALDILGNNPYLRTELLLLKLSPDRKTHAKASIVCAVINPFSRHKAEAEAVVNFLVQRQSAIELGLLAPSKLEPIENKQYQEELLKKEEEIRALEESGKNAEGFGKTEIENLIMMQKNQLEYFKENLRFLVSQEQIDWYIKEVVPYIFMAGKTAYESTTWKDNRTSLYYQLVGGALDQDSFIREMDNRIRLITQENQ